MNTDATRYLAYIHTPYEQIPIVRLFVSDGQSPASEVSLHAIADTNETLISYELPTLAPHFHDQRLRLPSRMVDVTEAARLIRGAPVSAQAIDPCTIWSLLRRHTQYGARAMELQNLIFRHGGRTDLGVTDVLALMSEVLQGLHEFWRRTREQLATLGELRRFDEIEQPVGALLLKTQQQGIPFNRSQVNCRLGDLGQTVTRSAAALRMKWNVLRPTDSAQLVAALGQDNRIRVDEVLRRPALASVIRARLDAALDFLSQDYALAAEIKRFRAASHDKAILLHLSARPTDRVHPPFTIVGTVTGRPLARTPALQYLSRSTRAVLCADDGKVLLYPDFCQFEPGILAEDSGDEKLQHDFNTGDLYAALSRKVFGTPDCRDQAKLIFLAFCYGMSVARAAELLATKAGTTSDTEALIATFFEEYSQLEPWRRGINNQLMQEGRIGSRSGNFRYRVRADRPLIASERRWSLSQRIQGTASLILKRAMLRVEELGIADLLLPMHDAALYQVDEANVADTKSQIEREFISAFTEECPNLRPSVKFQPFANEVTGYSESS
jgi:DNA polymerase I-like protein with 3'-5' exonuclease and polymerase domains